MQLSWAPSEGSQTLPRRSPPSKARRASTRLITRAGLFAALASGLVAGAGAQRAWATTAEGAVRVTMFDEPSTKNTGVRVIHPQADVTASVASAVNFAAGYSADVVSGATPAVFDVVSAATKFSDTRHSFHGGFGFEGGDGGISFSGSYGWESDYKSAVISGATHHDLYEHNFTLALAYSHNFDSVCDADNSGAAGLPLNRVPLASSADCFSSAPGIVTE